MKIKKVLENVKTKSEEALSWVIDNSGAICATATTVFIAMSVAYIKGTIKSENMVRGDWDFTNDQRGNMVVLMDEDGEYRSCLPKAAIAEVMENHKLQKWTNDMWRKLD